MGKLLLLVILATVLTVGHGLQPTNYDLSRNRQLGKPGLGFTLRDIWDFLVGGGYGHYPNYGPNYPTGPSHGGSYPGYYPGGQHGHYPNPGVVGPPGAHPGCPLCDSSVYSYCSHKQAHDACCCESPAYLPYHCRQSSCRTLYANSCEEYNLISSCCCVDLQKNSIEPVAPAVAVVA